MSGDDNRISTNVELNKKLQETGLDPEFWLSVLKEELSINNIQSIQYIQPEDCSRLEEKTRHHWEKAALRKLFNVPEKQEKRCQVMKEKNEQTFKNIDELKKVGFEGKDRHDIMVKEKEEEVRKALEIPSACSTPPDKSLVDLIDHYEKQMKCEKESLKHNDNMKDEEVLRCASGGLALEGIFQTQNIDDLFKKREPLLRIPKGFQLLGPVESPVFQQKEFTSKTEEFSFKITVEKIGLSLSYSASFGFRGFGVKSSTDYSKDSDSVTSSKHTSQQTYVCTTRYNYIPLASCYFTKDQLSLSQAALDELKDIETLIAIQSDERTVRMKCTDFFQRFGSHANLGPIHFGGIYWWKASMEGFTSDQVEEAKKRTSEALNVYVGASYAGNGGDVDVSHTNLQGSSDRSTISEFQKDVQFYSTKTGGPSEVDSIFHWRSGLVASNKTWSVIDRGFQLMPVWEIIVSNHRDQFTDVMKLASFLIDSYTVSTGLTSKALLGDNLVATLEKTKLFLKVAKSWKAEDAEEHLETLLDFKQTLCETTNSYTAWETICLSDKGLQEFFLSVVKKYQDNTEKDLYLIRYLLQELLEPHLYSVNIPEASVIMKWIYNSEKNECDQNPVTEFKQLLEILKKSKENISQITMSLSSTTEQQHQAEDKATKNISASLYSFSETMKKVKNNEIELLVLLTANNSGFCVKNLYFCNNLRWKEIEFLQNNIEEAYKEYTNLKSQCDEQAQAFVLYTGLTSPGEDKEMSAQQKADRMTYMKSHLEGCILPNVDKILHQQSECCDWSKMEDNLRAFAYGSKLKKEVSTDEIAKELKSLCKKKKKNFTSTSDEQTDCSNTDNDFLLLLERLDLVKYYPQKMETADLKIFTSSISDTECLGEKQLSFQYLQKLLTMDYRARYIQCKSDDDLCQNTVTRNGGKKYSVKDFLNDRNKKSEQHNASNEPPIHPMDVQMAIFHCANDFMRQYIYTKLSICQFGLPLLITNPSTKSIEFPLWSFQDVKKKWEKKTKAHDELMTDAQTSIVSFIRFGSSTSSKSQIINLLMSKQRHDIFYHRHCKGSTKKSVLMKGIAEIAWYCPGGKEDDAFDDCTAFINLHGDARELDRQVQFLEKISSVIVVLFNEPDAMEGTGEKFLEQLLESPKPLICLLADKAYTPTEPKLKIKIGLKNINEADLVNAIKTTIQSFLARSKQRSSLGKFANIARSQGFMVDLDKELCKCGKDQAEVLMSLLTKKPIPAMKEEFLPLQGDLWHTWCKLDKELTRLKNINNKSIEQQQSDILLQQQALRNRQLEKAFPLNDFVRSFLQILLSNEQSFILYFLQWLKMFLDNLSSETLSDLHKQYYNVWSELKVEKQKVKNQTVIQKLEENMEKLSTRINFSTFGLEHILRELGQIYEALETFSEKDKSFCTLPKIAAQLLVSGYPVELMDGDAAHVPLKWIGAVLDELIGIIGDRKLYVLSVLGIQSSGKSTLLNAMFGLQFAVSAGRCTRGAFMQLIKVDEELKHELNFEYVLVIDTEGLRAVGLSNKNSVNHDNELATFVIGLGNITLINIFGENPSEMQDILQIAVQAFLRMKQVNLKPSCLFVHQNIGEITAKEKNMEGRRRLQEKLDEMTRCAAEQEGCDVTCFNDVIQFDVNTQIHYFAHLWEGDPPMAPPNPSYSENVQELRKIILNSGKEEKEANILSISMFTARVNDLWTALLNENFVFNFKNSLEIAAYNTLETKYSHWAWSLREHMLTLQNTVIYQICNSNITSLDVAYLTKLFEEKYENIQENLNKFFTEGKNCELLIQWRASTENRLYTLKDHIIAEMKKNADELFGAKNCKNLDRLKETYEHEMFKESKKLALTLKERNVNGEELEEKFNKMWNGLINKVTHTIQLPQTLNIHQDLENVFLERFKTETNLVDTIKDSYNWEEFITAFQKYIQNKKRCLFLSENLKHDDQKTIERTTYALQRRVDEFINKKTEQKMDYQPVYFHEILNILNAEIKNMLDDKFKFIREYELYVSLFLCQKAAKRFNQISEAFRKANNPLVYLESKKNEFCQSFKISCKKTKDIESLAEFLCNAIKESIQQEVIKRAAIQLASDIKSNDPSFNGNRSKLEFCLLKLLAMKESFTDYIIYITDPQSAVQGFIEERVDMYLTEKVKISDILNIRVDFFRQFISKVIDRSTAEVTDKSGDIKSWIEIFCQGLENEIQLSPKDLKSVKTQDITDICFLKEAMTKALQKIVKNVKDEISVSVCLKSLLKMTSKMLCDQFPGCWKQSTFFKAFCTQSTDRCLVRHERMTCLYGEYKPRIYGKTNLQRIINFVHCSELTQYKGKEHPYNKVSTTLDNSPLTYWKWVICCFQSDFEEYFQFRFAGPIAIPEEWKNITKEEAIQEIEKLM